MQAVDEAFDHMPREQFEVADPRQDLRIDESCAGQCLLLHVITWNTRAATRKDNLSLRTASVAFDRRYIPLFGTGTAVSSSSMIESEVTPSDSARKFVSTRCRSTGCASARMSS